MAKALLIDVVARTISTVTVGEGVHKVLADMQRLIGGHIHHAWRWPSGDDLYVDDEGLLKAPAGFFRLAEHAEVDPMPLAGNGLVVGRERYDRRGEYIGFDDVRTMAATLAARVQFLSREQAEAWARGNASEPAVTLHSLDAAGQPVSKVVTRTGALFADIPKADDEEPG